MNPSYLKPNDSVAIVATARKVSMLELEVSIKQLESWGLNVVLAPELFFEENQFAGSDEERTRSLQWALDNEQVKAIFIARGGYGTLRIIDKIDFTSFRKIQSGLLALVMLRCCFHT